MGFTEEWMKRRGFDEGFIKETLIVERQTIKESMRQRKRRRKREERETNEISFERGRGRRRGKRGFCGGSFGLRRRRRRRGG